MIICIVIINSCNDFRFEDKPKKISKDATVSIQLKATDKLEFSIDKKTSPKSIVSYYYFDSINKKSYYTYLNKYENEIQFYSLKTSTMDFSIRFQKEGPNGVNEILSFYIKTLDSIFLVTKNYGTIYLANKEAEVINKYKMYNMRGQNSYEEVFMINILPGYATVFSNGSMYCCTSPNFINPWKLNSKEKTESKLTLKVDLETGESKLLNRYYPSAIFNNGSTSSSYRMAHSDGRFVYSFNYDHNLYSIYDNKVYTKKEAMSTFLNRDFSFLKNEPDFNRYIRYMVENQRYLDLIYDPFRKVFYRFAYKGVEPRAGEDLFKKNLFVEQFSVIVLNYELEVQGETLLEKNKFYHRMYFVAPEGLFISENHINNPAFDENKLKFRLFRLYEN